MDRFGERKEEGRGLASIQDSVDASMQQLEDDIKKTLRKTDYNNQNQHKQHKHQKNKNNLKTKIGRKTTEWTFQDTNKRHLTRENLDRVKKGETLKEKLNFFW